MPKYINTDHMKRMFPFKFFDELNSQLKDYIIDNPAFIIHHDEPITDESRELIYNKEVQNDLVDILNQNNIMPVEPFGEVLILGNVIPISDVDKIIKNDKNKSQIPISILIVQLYDSSEKPVFATEVLGNTIEIIPEVLWDDPNLLISIITLGQDEPTTAIVKIPDYIENIILEEK